jgi:hypothetical protein
MSDLPQPDRHSPALATEADLCAALDRDATPDPWPAFHVALERLREAAACLPADAVEAKVGKPRATAPASAAARHYLDLDLSGTRTLDLR